MEVDGAQQVVRKNTRTSELIKRSGRGRSKVPGTPVRVTSPLPVEALQATTASAFFPKPWASRCRLASSLLLPRPSRPGCLAAPQCWRLGALATGLPPLHPLPALPSLAPSCRSDHVVGDFHRGSGGGPKVRSAAGAGRVGGVKVGAQQNPPPRQHSQTCAATSTQVVVPGTAEMLPKVLLMLLNMFLALQWR